MMLPSPKFSHFLQRHGILLLVLLAAVGVIVLFSPGLDGGFLFDDSTNITDNVSLHMTGLDHISAWRAASSFPHAPGLRALPMLSLGLDYFRADSFDPAAYKATNLAIHAVTFLVLAGFLQHLLRVMGWNAQRAAWLGLALSLLWAIHPLQVSSVLYVVQRMQTMATLFLLLALWAYMLMRQAQLEGLPGWRAGGWTVIFWALALASKEDAILLPAYTLALELTVLRFAARSPMLAHGIKHGYAVLVLLGSAIFLFWLLPRWGTLEPYPGRNFNSYERVLTQGRVLLMYLGQIVWPQPDHMPFYYDDYTVSRGWLTPLSTLVAWLLLTGLMVLAWCVRRRRPLFALGIFWFFAGHFVTSNAVLGLELVFEHRNHFPLIGIVLALFDAFTALAGDPRRGRALGMAACGLALVGCGIGTCTRSYDWGNPLRFAQRSTELAPTSSRAWVDLCRIHFDLSQSSPKNPEFGRAIEVCQQGGERAGSVMALSNAIILKSVRGDASTQDWDRFLELLRKGVLTPENRAIAMVLIDNANHGVELDLDKALAAIEIIGKRHRFPPRDNVMIARFILEQTQYPEQAYPYLELAVKDASRDSALVTELLEELQAKGRSDWAERLELESKSNRY